MDDPWGSPWATSDTTSKHGPPSPPPPNHLLSPPPRAFFSSTSNLQSQSPWADGDAFGDWTSGDQSGNATNTVDWGVWAEPSSQPSPKPEEQGKRNSIAWPSSVATSPGLRPLPRSRASSVFRNHSPDPWAAEASLHNKSVDSLGTSPNTPENAAVGSQLELAEKAVSVAHDVAQSPETRVDDGASTRERKETSVGLSQEWELPLRLLDSTEPHDLPVNPVPKVEIHDTPSRPSSTFSLDSTNGIDRPDSPITSIDEDPKSRLQAPSRKASGKVQELVGMYDDLAKTTDGHTPDTRLEPAKESRGRSPSQTGSAGAEDHTDFGDFEDGGSDNNSPAPGFETLTTPGRSSTPKPRLPDTPAQSQTIEATESPGAVAEIVPVPLQQLVEKFGPIRFDVDAQSIKKLFPDLGQDEDDNLTDTSDITDQIIRDSFATISERKTWYRISRFGSMRKHDSGDEDNYHRIEWSTSQLHSETIKIVRRWMEEDSISGRPTLGAGNRSSVFNWDSSALPVDLGKVFARKASVTHSRNASVPLPNQSLGQSVQSTDPGSEARKPIESPIKPPTSISRTPASPIPNFGWGSGVNNSPSIANPVTSGTEGDGRVKSASQPTQATTEIKVRTELMIDHTKATLQDEGDEGDEEDDWGEMVSSPRVEVQPVPTLTRQPLNDASDTHPGPDDPTDNNHLPDVKVMTTTQPSNPMPKLSVTIPQNSQAIEHIPDRKSLSSAKTPRVDPWPLADFSIFENLSARTPKTPGQDPWPLADFSVFKSPTTGSMSNWMISPNRSKFNANAQEVNNVQPKMDIAAEDTRRPLKAVLGPIQKSNDGGDQDDIVRNIVQNLPDLSYMLR
ncbi:hypothetical protein GGR54DRAFT_622303 [Hypoxylon sp. NC1633]|nr:hypothetical protein GGR54DRAFT_622303 [Hypoxylon sp. NC1633]